MKFLLITGKKSRKIVRQMLLEEAQKYFDIVLFAPLRKIRVECDKEVKLYFRSTDLTEFDACYTRFFANDFVLAEIVLDILNQSSVFLPVSPEAYQVCNHKYYTTKILSKSGIPVPKSTLGMTAKTSSNLTNRLGFPVAVKLLSGFGGKGVMRSNSEAEFKPIVDTLRVFKGFICTQEFFEKRKQDVRAFVFGKEVYGIKRIAKEGDWRANVSSGGKAEIVDLSHEIKEIALKTAQLLGMEICAVDFIVTDSGPKVIEVNFCPGIFPDFFGNRFAKILVKYIYDRALEIKKIKTE